MNYPDVSLVIPIHNSEKYIDRLLSGIRSLEYNGHFEVIIVDNASTDHTYEQLKKTEFKVLSCTENLSSYAARNVGIEAAQYDFIAFTDADCLVSSDWLTNGISHLVSNEYDIVAGRVEFEFSDPDSSWEIYDSLVNMDNRFSVSRGEAKTANVFVRKSLFEKFRLFDDSAKSGEDVKWTSDMVKQGCRLSYCHEAVVYHPTRLKAETLVKARRVGSGSRHKYGALLLFLFFVKGFLPPNPFKWRSLLKRKESKVPLCRIYFPVWSVGINQSIGVVSGGN